MLLQYANTENANKKFNNFIDVVNLEYFEQYKPYDHHGIGGTIVSPVLQYSKHFFGTIIIKFKITVSR